MRKKKFKTDFRESGSFVQLNRAMLKSPAWQALSNTARLSYVNIKNNHFGNNSKEIICPFSKLINKMSPTTWAKATRELCRYGFITLERASSGLYGQPNVYGLSNEWKRWGTEAFSVPAINISPKKNNNGFKKAWEKDRPKMMEKRKERGEVNQLQ